ncbi:MAG: hypothetical protein WDA00_03265 [Eubacteriales bacterium]
MKLRKTWMALLVMGIIAALLVIPCAAIGNIDDDHIIDGDNHKAPGVTTAPLPEPVRPGAVEDLSGRRIGSSWNNLLSTDRMQPNTNAMDGINGPGGMRDIRTPDDAARYQYQSGVDNTVDETTAGVWGILIAIVVAAAAIVLIMLLVPRKDERERRKGQRR